MCASAQDFLDKWGMMAMGTQTASPHQHLQNPDLRNSYSIPDLFHFTGA